MTKTKLGYLTAAIALGGAMASTSAMAEPKLGVGFHGLIGGSTLAGAEGRYWMDDQIGAAVNVAYGTVEVDPDAPGSSTTETDLTSVGVKGLYALQNNANSRMYAALELGYFELDDENIIYGSSGGTLDGYSVMPAFGTEFNLSGLPEIGFKWEVGYRYMSAESDPDGGDNTDIDLQGINVTLGATYYLQ